MNPSVACLLTFLAVAALLFGGCATITPNDKAHEDAALRNLKERAAFDLGCDDANVVRLGDVARLGSQMTRTNFGATCGVKKASYVVTCVSNWGDISCTPEVNTISTPPAPVEPNAPIEPQPDAGSVE